MSAVTDLALGTRIDIAPALRAQAEAGNIGSAQRTEGHRLHTIGISQIQYEFRCNRTRWFQDRGNLTAFRLFDGDSMNNDRTRVEAHTAAVMTWKPQTGADEQYRWFAARYTIVEPQDAAIFQIKRPQEYWAAHFSMRGNDLAITTRTGTRVTVDRCPVNNQCPSTQRTVVNDIVGKSFDIVVVDNGRDYRLFLRTASDTAALNGDMSTFTQLHSDFYEDQFYADQNTHFRWGTYIGVSDSTDSTVLVSGARYGTLPRGVSLPSEAVAKAELNKVLF